MQYERMRQGEEREVSALVWRVFSEFEAGEYDLAGIREFQSFIAPESLAAKCESGRLFILCCKSGQEIVGVVALRRYSHIALLFVRGDHQRQGIARKLIELAVEACLSVNHELREITVHSSRYAIPVYRRLGFAGEGEEQVVDGMRFTAMRKPIGDGVRARL